MFFFHSQYFEECPLMKTSQPLSHRIYHSHTSHKSLNSSLVSYINHSHTPQNTQRNQLSCFIAVILIIDNMQHYLSSPCILLKFNTEMISGQSSFEGTHGLHVIKFSDKVKGHAKCKTYIFKFSVSITLSRNETNQSER